MFRGLFQTYILYFVFLQYPKYHSNKRKKNELQTAFQKPIANIIQCNIIKSDYIGTLDDFF